jgi:hypothetical protein
MSKVQVEQNIYEMPPREGFTVAHFLTVTDMELSFALELARAHCEFASGTIVEAEKRLRSLSIRAVTTGERVAYAEYIVREQTGEPPPS